MADLAREWATEAGRAVLSRALELGLVNRVVTSDQRPEVFEELANSPNARAVPPVGAPAPATSVQ